jgi:hypothetical protein
MGTAQALRRRIVHSAAACTVVFSISFHSKVFGTDKLKHRGHAPTKNNCMVDFEFGERRPSAIF